MCKSWENGAKWPTLRKSARAVNAGLRDGLVRTLRTSQSRACLGAWPIAFDAGPSQTPKVPRGEHRRPRTEAPKPPRGVGPAGRPSAR